MNETPEEYLRFVARAKGLRREELDRQIQEVIAQTRLGDVKHRRISALSKGYRQRVGIAQALLGSPKVIILDEPTVGLDPLQIIEIRDLIRQLGQTHTVIFSSHILSEVQTICDKILIIAHGKLVAFGDPESLEKQLLSPSEITLTAETGAEEIRSLAEEIPHITDISVEEDAPALSTVRVRTDAEDIHDTSRALFLAFAERKIPLLEMSLKRANLEDIFIELTESVPVGDASVEKAPEEKREESEVTDR